MADNSDMELVVQQEGATAEMVMNRPQVLNALSLEMIRMFSAGLTRQAEDESCKAVIIKGVGGRAFCAGGDVKSTYRTGMSYRRGAADGNVATLFFGEEYRLNRQLFHFEKPLIAFMDGITMGGGFGIAGPCRYRVATENTLFAMPEVVIGFFPDVGSTYFLNRCPGQAGAWLSLTGNKIGAEDVMYCGLATHYIPSAKLVECEKALREAVEGGGGDADAAIKATLDAFHQDPQSKGELENNSAVIDACFAPNDVRKIIQALRENDSSWAQQQADDIEERSPVSLKVSLANLRMTKAMDFDEVTAQDFILAQHFMQGHDFYEGVRALLVDKDQQPVWEPRHLDEVTSEMVQDYFRPIGPALDEIAA